MAFEITGKIQRNEIFEYPVSALRELLLNAVVHRDYTSPTDIQIKIFDNAITFFNPGKLYGGLTVAELKTDNYQSQTRDKLIAEAFYLTHDIEKYGSGYLRVRKEVADYPTMNFQYDEIGGGYLVELRYTEQRTETTPKPTGVPLNDPLNVPLNERVAELIGKQPGVQRKDLATQLDVTEKTVGRYISNLVSEGKIERRGSKKTGGYWSL